MYRHSWIALVAAAAAIAACGGGGSSATTSAGTPASPAAAPSSAASSNPKPCDAANCIVTVKIDNDVGDLLNAQAASYKVYDGCPRQYGVSGDDSTAATGLKSAPIIMSSPIPIINIPSGKLTGHIATIGMFWGSVIKRMVVVDFSTNPKQVVEWGYRTANTLGTAGSRGGGTTNSSGLEADPTVINHARTNFHKIC